jgi:hypothetical protein
MEPTIKATLTQAEVQMLAEVARREKEALAVIAEPPNGYYGEFERAAAYVLLSLDERVQNLEQEWHVHAEVHQRAQQSQQPPQQQPHTQQPTTTDDNDVLDRIRSDRNAAKKQVLRRYAERVAQRAAVANDVLNQVRSELFEIIRQIEMVSGKLYDLQVTINAGAGAGAGGK